MLLEQGTEANPLPSKNKNLSNSLLLFNPNQLNLVQHNQETQQLLLPSQPTEDLCKTSCKKM
jgi:hypothetical protein